MLIGRKLTAIFIAINLISLGSIQTYANNRDRTVTVMTRNMYLGTDLGEVFAEQTPEGVVAEVGEAYLEVQASGVHERIAKIADEIEEASPVLVGLQEVALWRIGAPFDPAPATAEAFDYLEILLDELASRGLSYEAVVVEELFDAEVPGVFSPTAALDVRFTDRLVILARSDLNTSQFKLEGTDSDQFDLNVAFPHPVLGMITIPRGFTAVDVKFRGKNYRFINAHLESFNNQVNFVQATEVLSGPANTDLSVILAGDFNSDAENPQDPFAAYSVLLSGGFTDSWEALHPSDPGYTWTLFLVSPSIFTNPSQRLDLVMLRGEIRPEAIEIVGEDPVADITSPSGFRPSDHAGVVADVVLEL